MSAKRTSPASCPVICIDGPSGVGKGTLARGVADHFGFALLDSGSLYRLTALSALRQGIALDDEAALSAVAAALPVEFVADPDQLVILLAGEDVSAAIREEAVGTAASRVAALPGVRAALLQRQRDFAQGTGLVADGRDMGTVVFPDAPVKLFLHASAEVRAQRRYAQLNPGKTLAKPQESGTFRRIFDDIVARDERDATRKTAPLRPADDAIEIDTSAMTIDAVLEQSIRLAESRLS